ncbi:MAG: RNA polymerase sigma-70 factor (ECF subfamily) [Rhodothermales bacterium]|jgi:RNA polymerase sigma-70 factor (ECF subfamily)
MSDTVDTIKRVLAGEDDAFVELIEAHQLHLRAYIAGKVLRVDDIDDIAQETIVAAFQHLDRFELDRDFAAWLRGIARFKVMNHLRGAGRRENAKQRFRDQVDVILHNAFEEATSSCCDSISALRSCISKLPERSQRVVRAGLEGSKAERLASEYGTSPAAIYNLQYRANKTLRHCVRRELEHE